tara:strand:+ start:12940 stop:13305 length:366 start_codon:yes stop_codon:yes gene_type:complete
MIILDRTQSSHTVNVIPSSYTPTGASIFRIKVTNEQQNTEVYNQTVSSLTAVDYYYTHTANLNLDSTKDQDYLLEITNTATNQVLYRDKIFATNQTVADYSINAGLYTTNTTQSNDFLVYE